MTEPSDRSLTEIFQLEVRKARAAKERGCAGCVYWSVTPDNLQVGECRQRGPQLVQATGQDMSGKTQTQVQSVWPRTIPRMWCGEWTPHGEEGEPIDVTDAHN